MTTKYLPVIKFFLVGSFTAIIDFGLYWVLIKFIEYHIALAISMIVAAVSNFIINRIITFKTFDKLKDRVIIFIEVFIITSILSQIIITGLVFLITNKLIARILTTGIIFLFNYILHKNFTFKESQHI